MREWAAVLLDIDGDMRGSWAGHQSIEEGLVRRTADRRKRGMSEL